MSAADQTHDPYTFDPDPEGTRVWRLVLPFWPNDEQIDLQRARIRRFLSGDNSCYASPKWSEGKELRLTPTHFDHQVAHFFFIAEGTDNHQLYEQKPLGFAVP